MTKTILNLERRKSRVLKMRSCYLFSCDKELDNYHAGLRKFDQVIDRIVGRIRNEWNKAYQKS